ncbi:MAG: polyribonucleotide nucleotidyltransferase [Holosporaceae bacterium]|jgi:polyribonucleotide nucleotidyltransferase|nr:polyribonucleotide nucleotidyltransferase [Holosporaceae bacterium]
MIVRKTIEWGKRSLSIETGRFANQATGSALVRYADTIVLCTVVADKKPNPEADFFPLTVNYVEKAYAAGKIPGGFVKREGRPSERETLISRLIDRPIRPLFHGNFKNETHVICTVLSFDGENDTDVISIIGASAALTLSGIPFLGPIAATKIGYKNGEFILNPSVRLETDLDLVVAGSEKGVLMVESGAKELSESVMLNALKFGHAALQPVINMIKELSEEAAKTAWNVPEPITQTDALIGDIKKNFLKDIEKAYAEKTKQERNASLAGVLRKVRESFLNDGIEEEVLKVSFSKVCSLFVRAKILKTGKRIDNRGVADIRNISAEVSVLPRVHGSAVFTRGETQALVVTTFGTNQDEQLVDSLIGEYRERFLLHYNFPPFSVGEVGCSGSPGRREIGHGKLAWRAIEQMLPSKEEFPYSIRVVSEILSCNGSSSMATVCGASLALMDAGVPMKCAVAGIAMGLIIEDEEYKILSDIMGEEDHLGDMDFKVAGTENGITALQMDIKVVSVTFEIMEKAMIQARDGRLHILEEMKKGLAKHRPELNKNAPKMASLVIPKDKIREVIGSGGKVIREIIDQTGTKIDIEDSGNVTVSGQNTASIEEALNIIKSIAFDPIEGMVYEGTVVKVMDFGAFVNFYGPKDGLLHISEMSYKRVDKVTDVMNEGDKIEVTFLGYDSKGRAKLTLKCKV